MDSFFMVHVCNVCTIFVTCDFWVWIGGNREGKEGFARGEGGVCGRSLSISSL